MVILRKEDYVSEFQKYFQDTILGIEKLDHKGNNQLFKIAFSDKKYILKRYSKLHRDNWERGKTEFKAITYMWDKGFREIPKPLDFDEKGNIAIYSYEQGQTLDASRARKKDILKAVRFLIKLNGVETDDKKKFSPASAACLNLVGYVDIIDRRLETMSDYEPKDFIGEEAKFFLVNQVYPKVEELKSIFFKKTTSMDIESELSLEEQVLSPGDFGFHNILIDQEDCKFIDFEYFGRDDPARQVLGFIHHDKSSKISDELKDYFLDSYKNGRNLSRNFEKRIEIVSPLVEMAWILIYLNVLSKDYMKHAKFAQGGIENLIQERLFKAEKKLKGFSHSF